MKKNIDKIIQQWISDDKGFVQDFDTIADYLIHITRHEQYDWHIDFFETEELENKSAIEMENEFNELLKKYRYVSLKTTPCLSTKKIYY